MELIAISTLVLVNLILQQKKLENALKKEKVKKN